VDETVGWVFFALVINTLFIIGGVVLIVVAMRHRMKKVEMQHRERMAMIERGLTPIGNEDVPGALGRRGRVSPYTTLGIAIVGIGLGLMLVVGVAGGAADAGVGIGGAIVVLGAAFILNGYLQRGSGQAPPPPGTPYNQPPMAHSQRFGPTDQPGPIAP
jgi:hypothetical protein